MAPKLNHTIVAAHDKHTSAAFLTRILGLDQPRAFGHFVVVELANGVSLDFDDDEAVKPQHYAFLIEDDEFDAIFERIKSEQVAFFADPGHRRSGEINTRDNGRGFYFSDPSGHNLEVLTRPYGER